MEIGGYDICLSTTVEDKTEIILFQIKKVWPEFFFQEHDSSEIFQPNSLELWQKANEAQCFFVYENAEAVKLWDEDCQPDNSMLYFLTDDEGLTLVVGIKDEFIESLVNNLKQVI